MKFGRSGRDAAGAEDHHHAVVRDFRELLLGVSVLDHRFGWSHVPAWVSVLGNMLVALA